MIRFAASERAGPGPLASLAWALALLAAAALVLAAVMWWMLPRLYPDVRLGEGRSIEIEGSRFAVPEGLGASRAPGATVVEALEEQQAVFVARAFFPTSQAAVLELALTGGHPDLVVELYWLTAQSPDQPRFARLHRGDEAVTLHRLAGLEGWDGQLVEVGVVLSGMHAIEPMRLEGLSLLPATRATLARMLWQDWRVFSPWRLGSTNYYRGAPADAPLKPTPVAAAWALIALAAFALIAWLKRWPLRAALPGAVAAVMLPWLALDGLWQTRLAAQLDATQARFGGLAQPDKRAREDDVLLQAHAHAVLDALAPVRGRRLFLVRDSQRHDYHRLRLQYHLLPLNVYNFGTSLPDPGDVRPGDFVALLDDPEAVAYDPVGHVLSDADAKLPAERVLTLQRLSLYRLGGSER
jgi:hypothetical protein